ncbi:hypothetical protein CI238_10160 [Colletotrichum incanum]|uniref:Uncharacterized protein n=1 Tax=Colletotrichum incanum TaxID=1573173 RepID=A0A162N7Y2_COLIC|nr:hypothetical protein CI238_10160 [Colletotrichum incanum]
MRTVPITQVSGRSTATGKHLLQPWWEYCLLSWLCVVFKTVEKEKDVSGMVQEGHGRVPPDCAECWLDGVDGEPQALGSAPPRLERPAQALLDIGDVFVHLNVVVLAGTRIIVASLFNVKKGPKEEFAHIVVADFRWFGAQKPHAKVVFVVWNCAHTSFK